MVLVPWLRTLEGTRTLAGAAGSAWAMAVAYTLGVFAWFAVAIDRYTGIGTPPALALLLVAAPLFQPQFIAYAVVRHLVGRRHGALLRAVAAAAAWLATEALVPRLLDDTLAYGLHPSRLVRQAADLGGASGLTFALLLANEAFVMALVRRPLGLRTMLRPLSAALLVPLMLAAYGYGVLATAPAATGQPLRVGLVQSAIVDYERLRREKGAAAVVREVLDVHEAMSRDAVERHRVDAMLWSETVYPTTFAHPKSEAGAELDREVLGIVDALRVPVVFGTYDRDEAGEYIAAAFVNPGSGLLGFYRKTHPFPLTEHVPAWLDGPRFRAGFPWTGTWQRGNGARVFPLRLADGREVPVLPLICLDDMDARLAVEGARLGAQAILTLSNDSWFNAAPGGAALHQAAAAFRSIETRLPQFRVTPDGYSAVIDATGSVVAGSRLGERTLVVGEAPVGDPRTTLIVAWGDWVGIASAAFLVLLALVEALRRASARHEAEGAPGDAAPGLPADVAVLPPAARIAAAGLRAFARGSLLWMAAALLRGDGALQANTLAQIRAFAVLVLVPEAAATCVLLAFAARASIERGSLVLARGAHRLELALRDIAMVEPWRWPLPASGASFRLTSGARWPYGLVHRDPHALAAVLERPVAQPRAAPAALEAHARARSAMRRGRLDHPLAKFVLLPFVLAVPAFRLHQHITYGSAFGEWIARGPVAYAMSFAQWWAAWAIGVVLCAAVLRAAIETGAAAAAIVQPAHAGPARRGLERAGLVALYLGVPAWLLARTVLS